LLSGVVEFDVAGPGDFKPAEFNRWPISSAQSNNAAELWKHPEIDLPARSKEEQPISRVQNRQLSMPDEFLHPTRQLIAFSRVE